MASGKIKGITIEFRGETSKLESAIKKVDKETAQLDKELRSVNNALKFNPKNADLMAQKQELLTQKVGATEDKLKSLKDAQAKLAEDDSVDKNSAEWRGLEREIITTENKLERYKEQLIKTRAETSKLGKASMKFDTISKSLDKAYNKTRRLSQAAGALTLAMGGSAIKAGVWADDLNTLSKVTGIGTDDLQKYALSADLVDVSIESIAKSQKKLKQNMLGALDGTNDQAQYFKELGVEITNADGSMRDASDVFDDTVIALGQMENATQRDAYAMALMGKSATDLNPLIEDGGETYKEVLQILEDADLAIIDQDTIDKANAFNDVIDTMKLVGMQLLNTVGAKVASFLLPRMEKAQKAFSAVAKAVGNLSDKTLATIMGIATALAALAPTLLVFSKASKGLSLVTKSMAKIVANGGKMAKVLSFFGANPFVLVIAGAVALAVAINKLGLTSKDITKFFDNLTKKAATLIPLLTDKLVKGINAISTMLPTMLPAILQGAVTLFTGIVDALPVVLPNLLKAVASLIGAVVKNLPTFATSLLNAAVKLFGAFVTAIPKVVKSVKDALPQIANAVVTYLKTTFKDKVKDSLKAIPSWFGNAFSKAWSAIKGKFSGWTAFWSGLWTKVTNKFSDIGKSIGSAISSTLKSGINGVLALIESTINKGVDKINSAIDWVNKVIPKKHEFGHVNHVSLPRLARGGIVDSATLAVIGEGSSSEAVVPLDEMWKKMAKMLGAGGGGQPIVVNVYGSAGQSVDELAAAVERRLIASEKRRREAWA